MFDHSHIVMRNGNYDYDLTVYDSLGEVLCCNLFLCYAVFLSYLMSWYCPFLLFIYLFYLFVLLFSIFSFCPSFSNFISYFTLLILVLFYLAIFIYACMYKNAINANCLRLDDPFLTIKKLMVVEEFFSGTYLPAFSPNTGKYGPLKTRYLDTFHAAVRSH